MAYDDIGGWSAADAGEDPPFSSEPVEGMPGFRSFGSPGGYGGQEILAGPGQDGQFLNSNWYFKEPSGGMTPFNPTTYYNQSDIFSRMPGLMASAGIPFLMSMAGPAVAAGAGGFGGGIDFLGAQPYNMWEAAGGFSPMSSISTVPSGGINWLDPNLAKFGELSSMAFPGSAPSFNMFDPSSYFGGTGPTAAPAAGGGFGVEQILEFLSNPTGAVAKGLGIGGGPTGRAGPISQLFDAGTGIFGLYQTYANRKRDEERRRIAAGMADPQAAYRSDYARQLYELMQNPGSITSRPGYQFRMNQGTQAVARRMAGSGYAGSGNEAIALTEYGQGFASDELNKEIARLAGLAGGSPESSARIMASGSSAPDTDFLSRSLATLGYGLRRAGV